MALIAYNETHIVSGQLGNKRAVSCAGVPAFDVIGGLPDNAYIAVDLYLALAVSDSGALYCRPVNGYVRQTGMTDAYGNDWDAFFVARTSQFNMSFTAGGGNLWDQINGQYFRRDDWMTGYVGTNGTGTSDYGTVGKPTSEQDALSKGFAQLPFNIDDIPKTYREQGGHRITTGHVYLCIPVLYNSTPTDSVSISSVEFTIELDELLRYHPFAIRKGGEWKSANREGGSTKIRKSSAWRDVYNIANDESDQDAFIRQSGSWARAPEIGSY